MSDDRTFNERKAGAVQYWKSFFRAPVSDHDASPEQQLRNRIDTAKARAASDPSANESDNLRNLRRRHYERTGASGG